MINKVLHRALNILLLSALFYFSTSMLIPFNYKEFDIIQTLAGGVTLGYISISFAGIDGTESHRTKITFVFLCILVSLYFIDGVM